ncbi:MAG: hypothetical protein IJP49_01310 [Bacteroidales bacterium]|nr:hypothetical protein [Bacteroidales bacterium]
MEKLIPLCVLASAILGLLIHLLRKGDHVKPERKVFEGALVFVIILISVVLILLVLFLLFLTVALWNGGAS